MLTEITKVAEILSSIDAKNIEMVLDEDKISNIKNQIASKFTMYDIDPPYLLDTKDLIVSISGVNFHIKKEEKPEYIGKFKLALPSMLVNVDDKIGSMINRIHNSYMDREDQILTALINGKEDLIEWASNNKSKMSPRLYNAIIRTKPLYGLTIDELTWEEWFKYRGCGKKSWDEFVKLRGY